MSGSVNGTTAVPAPTFDAAGLVAPSEAQILPGALADWNAALGGSANTALSTPQGQVASSFTAALGDAYDQILFVLNGVDPARASGRLQDAIGAIYFIERKGATETVITAAISGTPNLTVTEGYALIKDGSGSIYTLDAAVTLNPLGTGVGTFSCTTAGAIVVTSISINQAFPGVTSVTLIGSVTGSATETPKQFEARRQASVEGSAVGVNNAIRAALLSVPGVTDAYVTDNGPEGPLTVGGIEIPASRLYLCVNGGGATAIGQAVISKKPPGVGYVTGPIVTISGGGGAGATAVANVSNGEISSITVTAEGSGYTSAPTITISGNGSGATASATITGGAITAIAVANPGTGYVATQSVTVADPNSVYTTPPTYTVTYTPAVPVPLYVQVTLTNSSAVPSTALASIQAAVLAVFAAAQGFQIGQTTYSSSFYNAVAMLGAWAQIVEITIGTAPGPSGFTAAMNISQIPTLAAADVTLVLQ